MSIFTTKISDAFFAVLNVVYEPFFTRKTTTSEKIPWWHLFFVLSRASDNTTSQKYLGDECMGRLPTSNFGGLSPQSIRN